MKILQIANFDRKNNLRYFYNCDFKIFNGLIRNGHSAYQFSDRDVAKEITPLKSRFWGKKKANHKLIDIFKILVPNVVIAGHTDIIENETFEELRKINPNVKIIFFNVDAFFLPDYQRNVDYLKSKSKIADCIFSTTADPDILKQFSGNRAKVSFFPNPFDVSIDYSKAFENPSPEYDIFFAGGWPYRHQLMDKIENETQDLKIFRCGLTNKHRIFGNEFIETLSNSRMGMNFPHGEERKFTPYLYSSDRISQYIGNGLLTFMDKKCGYQDYFTDEEMVFYESQSELIDKIKYFKSNDSEARKIAESGWKKGHQYYNSTLVTKYMLERSFDQKLSEKYHWPTEVQ